MKKLSLSVTALLVFLLAFSFAANCLIPVHPLPGSVLPAGDSALTPSPTATGVTISPVVSATPYSTQVPVPTQHPALMVNPDQMKGTEIQVSHALYGNAEAGFAELVAEFNRSNSWGIRVNSSVFPGYQDLIETIHVNTHEPSQADVIIARPELLSFLAEEGILGISVDSFLYQGDYQISSSTLNSLWPVFSFNDQKPVYGLPFLRDAQVMVYNRTWAHALGFEDPPLSLEAFKTQVCKAAAQNKRQKNAELHGTGGWFMTTDPMAGLSWLAGAGQRSVYDNQDQKYIFNSENNRQVFAFLRTLSEDYCAWNNNIPQPDESTEPFIYFPARQALLASVNVSQIPRMEQEIMRQESQDDWVILPFPDQSGQGVIVPYGYDMGILSKDPEKQLASWLFLRWLFEPEQSNQLAQSAATLPLYRNSCPSAPDQMAQACALLYGATTPAPTASSWIQAQKAFQDAQWENMVQYQLIFGIENVKIRSEADILQDVEDSANSQP